MNRNLEIRLLKVDGDPPIPLSGKQKDRLDGLHLEVRHVHEAIEEKQVDDRSPRPRGLPNYKQAAVKAGRWKWSKLHSTLGNQSQGDLLERSPFDGSRGIRRHGDGFRRQWRRSEERYAIPLPEDLLHPRICAPSLQACQWRDRQPPDRVKQGDGSYFRKPEGFEEGADPLPPLKSLLPPERKEDAERFPDRCA